MMNEKAQNSSLKPFAFLVSEMNCRILFLWVLPFWDLQFGDEFYIENSTAIQGALRPDFVDFIRWKLEKRSIKMEGNSQSDEKMKIRICKVSLNVLTERQTLYKNFVWLGGIKSYV